MKNNIIFTCILLALCTSSAHAKSAFYTPDANLLFVPEFEIEGRTYIDGVLSLDNTGEYRVNTVTALDSAQQDLLKKINSTPPVAQLIL